MFLLGFFRNMKNWPPGFFLVDFLTTPIFFTVGKIENVENVVISERTYKILEIMSIQDYKMWTNELIV